VLQVALLEPGIGIVRIQLQRLLQIFQGFAARPRRRKAVPRRSRASGNRVLAAIRWS
jgi:hypothetical protein